MIIAQLSDFHARPPGLEVHGLDTNALMNRAVDAVLALSHPPDRVVVSGDLADAGEPEAYEVVRRALARLPMPVDVVPGNHDAREPMAAALRPLCADLPTSRPLDHVVEDGPVRLILLDTLAVGTHAGMFDRDDWFAARLDEGGGRPTLVVMHHPPFLTGVHGMDVLTCHVSERFGAIVREHPEIERIACGHYHRPIQLRWNGTMGFVAPGTAHQVALDLRPGRENRLILEPPGFALHVWHPDLGLVSHTVPIGDFGPSRSFDGDDADA